MKILTFGEMMLRLKPPLHERILQANQFEAAYGGSEANVAVSLALMGDEVAYLTKLPTHFLGQAALNQLRSYGVDTSRIIREEGRLGIYFFEKGASIRSTNVIYDRKDSVMALSQAEDYAWDALFQGIDLFYFSGITPAISDELARACLEACQYCQAHGITVACDLNYRGKLWSTQKAQQVMREILPYVKICMAHDEDFEQVLGIQAYDGDETRGIEQLESYQQAMAKVRERYPNMQMVASVVRNIHSVENSQWMGVLLDDEGYATSAVYDMHVMEGVGGGDAFGAGLIHGLIHHYDRQQLIDYAMAASVLKLTIHGDFNLNTEAEIMNVMSKGKKMQR